METANKMNANMYYQAVAIMVSTHILVIQWLTGANQGEMTSLICIW